MVFRWPGLGNHSLPPKPRYRCNVDKLLIRRRNLSVRRSVCLSVGISIGRNSMNNLPITSFSINRICFKISDQNHYSLAVTWCNFGAEYKPCVCVYVCVCLSLCLSLYRCVCVCVCVLLYCFKCLNTLIFKRTVSENTDAKWMRDFDRHF